MVFHSGDPDEWKPLVAIAAVLLLMFIALGMLVSLAAQSF
jgi:hypothetical protein